MSPTRPVTPHVAQPATNQILLLLDEGYCRRSWHGPNLRGSLRGLTAEQAAWRAAPGKRSIAEIVVHCAYWKYAVRRRLRGDNRGSFALKGSNWFALTGELTQQAWRDYVGLLEREHRALRAVAANLAPRELARSPAGGQTSCLALLHGVALHDVYHAGQIQLVKGLNRVSS